MLKPFFTAMLAATLSSCAASVAWSQTPASPPDPLDAAVSVPAVTYESSFSRYRRFAEQEVAPWKETNDTAGRIGGWRVYAREARQPQPRPDKPLAADAAKPMPGGQADQDGDKGAQHAH